MSFETVHDFANQYVVSRAKHYKNIWLNGRNTIVRLIRPNTIPNMPMWGADIESSHTVLQNLQTELNKAKFSCEDLKDYNVFLKNQNHRIADRINYLVLFAGFSASLVLLIEMFDMNSFLNFVPIVLGVAAINERAGLNALKTANNELGVLFDREIERQSK